MGSISSEDERYRSYSPSADVSESESCSDHSFHHHDHRRYCDRGGTSAAASSSLASSPLPSGASFRFPAAAGLLDLLDGEDGVVLWDAKPQKPNADPSASEVEMMKERFAKLLLGEDMSGGGKGVCTALAISNAITNLSATVFGELWRLEPLAERKKAMWGREMEWLLCVSDSIVELTPSIQEFPGGGTLEVMVPRPRSDLFMNLPALKKLDAMLIAILDGFCETEFWYVDRGVLVGEEEEDGGYPASSALLLGRPSVRQEEKWWLPCPRVPANGLSEEARKTLQQCRDCASQILKAAMAINSAVLADMAIPEVYYETLPKSGKSCLGDIIYRYITAEQFSPECLLDCLDLSSEHRTLEIANRIEAAIHVWKLKDRKVHSPDGKVKKASWGGKVKGLVIDTDKNQFLAQRAEGLLQSLRLRYTGLPQTVLDMNKIQYNKDVGQSILESYSRVMESLAFNIVARIDDVIYVDDTAKECSVSETANLFNPGGLGALPIRKRISPSPFSIQNSPYASPVAAPGFYSSVSVPGSPLNWHCFSPKKRHPDARTGKHPVDAEKMWSYAGNLSLRRDAGDAPERD